MCALSLFLKRAKERLPNPDYCSVVQINLFANCLCYNYCIPNFTILCYNFLTLNWVFNVFRIQYNSGICTWEAPWTRLEPGTGWVRGRSATIPPQFTHHNSISSTTPLLTHHTSTHPPHLYSPTTLQLTHHTTKKFCLVKYLKK